MVAKISVGSSLFGALAYNQNKLDEAQGKVLLSNRMFESEDGNFSIRRCMECFDMHLPADLKTEKPIIHISLNPHPDDVLSDSQLADIAKEYMKSCWYMEGGRTGILRRLSLDEPSLAVLTSPSQKQTDRCHPLEARPFTIRENARCQSFPDDWQFCGSVGSQYKQVGNAVPVNLALDIGKKIKEALEEL